MILAAAQIQSIDGDVLANMNEHERWINLAAESSASLIAFPEMSITGYSRKKGKEWAFTKNDSRLNKLFDLSEKNNITIIAGAPIQIDAKLHIGSFILFPNKTISIYTKQFLHEDESLYYSPSFAHNPIIELNNERISLAICADISNPLHAENASKQNTSIYLPSIFFTKKSMAATHEMLSGYAKKYGMSILMSNYCGINWGLEAGGESAFWTGDGKMVGRLDRTESGLLIVEEKDNIWSEKIIQQ